MLFSKVNNPLFIKGNCFLNCISSLIKKLAVEVLKYKILKNEGATFGYFL